MINTLSNRVLTALLALSLLIPLCACGGEGTGSAPTADTTQNNADTVAAEAETDKLEGIDYGGIEIRIQTSINDTDATNANALIEGTGAENGDVANDAVYKRNTDIEELLNVKFKFTESDETYDTAQAAVEKIVMAGDDIFDIIIQDLRCMASLSINGMFLDVSDQSIIDFSQSYWWTDYMKDLSLGNDTAMYILAGDYFADVLCSAHALYFNKQQLESYTGDGNAIYNKVLDGTWTCDELIKFIEMAYQDLNGDSKVSVGDNFGYTCIGTWGSAIPFMICGNLNYITRDDNGVPTFTLDKDERAAKTLETLNRIFYDNATYTKFADIPALRSNFISGLTLFCGYQRVGDFQYFRETQFDVGLCPYPKLDDSQDGYVTSTHNTAEIGVIPITNTKLETTCTVIEALCRETQKTVIPAYYETSLKVKYARDDFTSQMLDIVHDNLRVSFPLAYDYYLDGNIIKNTFSAPLTSKSTDFASTMAKITPTVTAKLAEMIEIFNSNAG